MTKSQQLAYQQRLINNLNNRLEQIDRRIMKGVQGSELQSLEQSRSRITERLSQLYGTEKYGLVSTT